MCSLHSATKFSLDLDGQALRKLNFPFVEKQPLSPEQEAEQRQKKEAIQLALEVTLDVIHVITIYIRAQGAEATPPLGTVLGNLGVNSIKFCKEFNEFTQDLPSYITLGVSISVLENRTYNFHIISGPSIGHLLSFLRYEANLWEKNHYVVRNCISLKAVIQLTLYRFPQAPLRMAFPAVVAMINASDLVIIYDEAS